MFAKVPEITKSKLKYICLGLTWYIFTRLMAFALLSAYIAEIGIAICLSRNTVFVDD